MTLLIVVDMQNDFVTGALGTAEAQAIVPHVNAKIAAADAVVYTLDTHGEDYLATQEGKRLPVPHCIRGTWGHALADGLHIARFFQGLETELAALCAQWKAEQINL